MLKFLSFLLLFAIVDSYFRNYLLSRLMVIAILNADVNPKNSNDSKVRVDCCPSVQPSNLRSVPLDGLQNNYWFIPEFSDADKAKFKAWVDRITEDVLNGKNDTEAKEVCSLKFGTEMCASMPLALILG